MSIEQGLNSRRENDKRLKANNGFKSLFKQTSMLGTSTLSTTRQQG